MGWDFLTLLTPDSVYNSCERGNAGVVNGSIMIIKRITTRFLSQDWPALLAELLIVIVGIFIAIQVENWRAHREDLSQEQAYIARLAADIERDVEAIQFSISLAEHRLGLADLLIAVAREPELARQRPAAFITAVHQSSYTHTPSLHSATFEELRSTGGLGLLRDDALKTALFEYYRYDEAMRQYLNLQHMTEVRHFELAAGVLTNEQYVWMQDNIGYSSLGIRTDLVLTDVQLDGLVDAAHRLQSSSDFVEWLPEGRGMQLELIDTHRSRLSRAEALLTTLETAGAN